MEYHSADLLSSTDSSSCYYFYYLFFSSCGLYNPFNPYNISYAYFIFSLISLSLPYNYFSPPYKSLYIL